MKKLFFLLVFILSILVVYFITRQKGRISPIPEGFSTNIDNPYFSLPIGRTLIYEGQTKGGTERVVINISGETKDVLGVTTLIYNDKAYLNGVIVEETNDYLAQDSVGNVWYFGEDVNNYERGELIDHEGSWLAGVNGAEPGIWIKNKHIVGDSYKQEYYNGEAEDMRDVISVNESVTISLGAFKDCVKMYDWTPLDPSSREHKVYCTEVGAMVLETNLETNTSLELVDSGTY